MVASLQRDVVLIGLVDEIVLPVRWSRRSVRFCRKELDPLEDYLELAVLLPVPVFPFPYLRVSLDEHELSRVEILRAQLGFVLEGDDVEIRHAVARLALDLLVHRDAEVAYGHAGRRKLKVGLSRQAADQFYLRVHGCTPPFAWF